MSAALVLVCDAPVPGAGTYGGHVCSATSRAATTEPALRAVTGRDGWAVSRMGGHLCPFHAAALGVTP